MLESLKKEVFEANLRLVDEGLVVQTWGNVSGIDRERGVMVIKPSGVPYSRMKPCHMVMVTLATGKTVAGDLNPSSDTPTHLELYRAFPGLNGVVHTHSLFATAWAQACREVPALGTTHADYFHGPVPCTRVMRKSEIENEYEANTGRVIVQRFKTLPVADFPGVLVANHGPFTWGSSPAAAVDSAVVLEFLCKLASETLRISPDSPAIPSALLDKHFLRKHGAKAYYGQKR